MSVKENFSKNKKYFIPSRYFHKKRIYALDAINIILYAFPLVKIYKDRIAFVKIKNNGWVSKSSHRFSLSLTLYIKRVRNKTKYMSKPEYFSVYR